MSEVDVKALELGFIIWDWGCRTQNHNIDEGIINRE